MEPGKELKQKMEEVVEKEREREKAKFPWRDPEKEGETRKRGKLAE